MSEDKLAAKRHKKHIKRSIQVVLLVLPARLVVSMVIGLCVGYKGISFSALQSDPSARAVLFRLRLPRVLLAALVGASLALVGAALQALCRYPLAERFTLGLTVGASLGASLAIARGLGINILGVP